MKTKRLGITVLMPTFNQGAFISRAITSLKLQTFQNWQLIIIDDGSADYTAQIVRDLLPDDRIVFIQNERNQGVGYCLNQGLRVAIFPLIAYLPSDDIYYANHLQTLYEELLQSETVVAVCSGVMHHYRDHFRDNYNGTATGQIPGRCLQLVQVLHYKTEDKWTERAELVTDDYGRMFWEKLAQRGNFVSTKVVTCEWIDHPAQRHKLINEQYGGNIYVYKRYYGVTHPLRYHSSASNLLDEFAYYQRFQVATQPSKNDGLKILIVGELGYNPERLLALEERGHRLYGLWISQPANYNGVGPFPFGHIEDIGEGGNWQQRLREIQPDIIYALLNYQAVPLAHHILWQRGNIPFVWHGKEGPFYSRQQGAWRQLMELYALSDGQIYGNPETRDWITQFMPEEGSLSLILDGDLPKREWFSDEQLPLLSAQDGELHTVIPGRPVGLTPQHMAALAAEKIHLHFYGDIQQGYWREWIDQAHQLAPGYLHTHPHCEQGNWAREFSQYDAGWLHYFESDNQGELLRVKWNDLNLPARIGTYAIAGLPMIQRNNTGHIVATQALTRQQDIGIFINDIADLGMQLRDKARMQQLRANVWRQRLTFCFDTHADELVAFFRMVIDRRKGPPNSLDKTPINIKAMAEAS